MFKFLEFLTEVIGWITIVFSPLCIGITIRAIIYYSEPNTTRLIYAFISTLVGLSIGIFWASKQWKEKGTMWFLSRTIASPDLDNLDKKQFNEKK